MRAAISVVVAVFFVFVTFAHRPLFGFSKATSQEAVELTSQTFEHIPRDPYKTWSLFLICNPEWVTDAKSRDLADLYRRFTGFGDAIGRDNLAVWFWKRRVALSDPGLAKNVDVARSAEFCAALGKPPSHGPYLVVTQEYPDLSAFPKQRAIFELGGSSAVTLGNLLNTLTDQLLLKGQVEKPTPSAPQPPAPNLWTRLLEGARQSLLGAGCAVKLQVDAGPVKAELRGCNQ